MRGAEPGSAIVDGLGFSLFVDHDGADIDAQAVAQRIASLLTQDDERIAREGHLMRSEHYCSLAREDGHVIPAALYQWNRAACVGARLPELDRLEAAYRSTVAAGADVDARTT